MRHSIRFSVGLQIGQLLYRVHSFLLGFYILCALPVLFLGQWWHIAGAIALGVLVDRGFWFVLFRRSR